MSQVEARARISVQRRVEWSDTDAAGHQHFTAVLRWVEEAEHLLYEQLGLDYRTPGRCPRVHVEADFSRRLYPRAIVDVELVVSRVGGASVTYDFDVRLAGDIAAHGRMVAVRVAAGGEAAPWPDADRRALLGAGAVQGERLAGSG